MNKEYHWFANINDLTSAESSKLIEEKIGYDIDRFSIYSSIDYTKTRLLISNQSNIILTTISSFITADLIKSGYEVYLHLNKNSVIKVDKNTYIGSEQIGRMKSKKNVEQWCLRELLGLN